MENQQGNYGKVLPVFAAKRPALYASVYITPGGQCYMLTPLSPFLAFGRSQCPRGYAEREERESSHDMSMRVWCVFCADRFC